MGRVHSSHGLKGQFYLELYSGDPASLLSLTHFTLRDNSGTEKQLSLTELRPFKRGLLVTSSELTHVDDVQALRGQEVLLPESAFPPLKKGETYLKDLLHTTVISEGKAVGEVVAFEQIPSQVLLHIQLTGTPAKKGKGDSSVSLPYCSLYFGELDHERRTLEVFHWAEALAVLSSDES